jgi:hypothetical protein
MKEVSVEYRYTLKEAVTATVEVTKCVFKFFVLMPWVGIASLVFCVAGVFIFNWSAPDLAAAGVIGIVFTAMPFITRWSAKRRAKKLPSLNNLIKWRITEGELHNSTEGAEARFVWDKIIRVHERKGGFLLFPQPRIAHWIPKHGFQCDTDIDLFKEIVRSKSIKYNG